MATIDVGKIRFNWLGAYAGGTTYSQDDVVSYSGTSWVYVNATPAAGQTPADNAYWDIMADGSNPMTAAGDVIYGGGSGTATRLPIGAVGTALKAISATTVGWAGTEGLEGWEALGSNIPMQAHTTDADVTISRPWLARYNGKSGASADYIPYDGLPNTWCGPNKRQQDGAGMGGQSNVFFGYLNMNHELVMRGYSFQGAGSTQSQVTMKASVNMPMHMEFGGMADGEWMARLWYKNNSMYMLTNKGNLWVRGENSTAQLGLGDVGDRHQWVRNPYLGPDATNNGITCEVSTLCLAGNIIASSGAYNNCFAILHDGRVLAWGQNISGSLGLGDAVVTNIPELISPLSGVDIVTVAGGYNATMFLDSAGDVWTTGLNTTGINLGTARTAPVKSAGVSDVKILVANMQTSYCHAFAIQTDGDMYALGYNAQGELGLGDLVQRSAWTQTGGSINFSGVTCIGMGTTGASIGLEGVPGDLFDTAGKTVYVTGDNGYGILCQGNTTNSSSWIQPSATTYGTSYLKTSTSADGTVTSSNLTFPRTAIKRVIPCTMLEASHLVCFIDSQDRMWFSGYWYENYGYAANTGTTTYNLAFMYPGPWSHTRSSGTKYNGNSQVTLDDFYNSRSTTTSYGIWVIRGSDNSLWAMGPNDKGVMGPSDQTSVFTGAGSNVHWARLGAA